MGGGAGPICRHVVGSLSALLTAKSVATSMGIRRFVGFVSNASHRRDIEMYGAARFHSIPLAGDESHLAHQMSAERAEPDADFAPQQTGHSYLFAT